jgi:hypothetical protein
MLALGLVGVGRANDDVPAAAATPAESAATEANPSPVEHPHIGTRLPHGRRAPVTTEAILNERVRLLTLELDLNESQQAKVHDILVRHGETIRRIWLDRTLTEGQRVPLTSAVGEKTADAIRDVLTPKQREKYNPPRPNTDAQRADATRDLSKWIDAIHQK